MNARASWHWRQAASADYRIKRRDTSNQIRAADTTTSGVCPIKWIGTVGQQRYYQFLYFLLKYRGEHIARSILVQFTSSFFSICFVSVQVVHPYSRIETTTTWKNCYLFYWIGLTSIWSITNRQQSMASLVTYWWLFNLYNSIVIISIAPTSLRNSVIEKLLQEKKENSFLHTFEEFDFQSYYDGWDGREVM